MKTMYSLHPSFAPSAKLPIASIHYPIAVHEGNQQTLNDEQLAAIAPLTGRCVVNSGAGTGKTTVLVARMLAIQEQFPGSHVLMLTFSRKAALELRDRIGSTPGCQVSTFHSICYHILQANGFKDFSVNTNEAARDAALVKLIGKKTDTTTEKVIRSMNRITDIDKPTETIRERFFKQLLTGKVLTFDSMQPFALRLLQKQANVLHAIQNEWNFILVDEAQDMDEVQIALVHMLAKNGNTCLVGDVRQSIYGFRGAVPSGMDDFAHEFDDAQVREMTVNYRSSPCILGLANKIMCSMPPLSAASPADPDDGVFYLTASDEADEAARVIDQIKHLHKDGMRYDHIAILYRSSFAASALLEALLDKQLPFRCKSHTSLKAWTSPFREAVEIMRYALQPNDAKLFKPLLRALYIRQALMPEIRKLAKKNGCSLIHAATLLQLPFFQTEYVEKMDTAVSSMAQQPPADAVLSLLDAGDSQCAAPAKSDMLLAWTQELEEFPSIPALITHIDDLHDQLSAIRSQSSKAGDALQLMTIHASKGLEFDCVFLIGTADGILPSGKDDVDMDEERRLLYVAVTRAKHRLYVSYPARSSNSSNENKASRFLLDALSRI